MSEVKNTQMRDRLLTCGAIALLFVFLWWACGDMNRDLGLGLPRAWRALNGYELQILNLVAVYGILAISLNIIYGFTGMFSLGHAGFMAIGAYVSALCVLTPDQKEMMWLIEEILPPLANLYTPFWFSVILGGLVSTVFALLIGIPVLRLGGDYLGIATLGFSEIIRVLIVNATSITNGSLGIKGIPCYTDVYTSFIWLIVVTFCIVRLLNSNFGNVLKAVRDDEIAAQVMGINVFHTKLFSFCLGAFLAGVGGALLGNLLTTIDPKMFTFLLTYNVLMIVVAGGLGSITGSIPGSAIITVLLEWLRVVEEPMNLGFVEIPGIPGMRMVVFSVVLLIIILYRREGVMGMREFSWNGFFRFFRRFGKKEEKA